MRTKLAAETEKRDNQAIFDKIDKLEETFNNKNKAIFEVLDTIRSKSNGTSFASITGGTQKTAVDNWPGLAWPCKLGICETVSWGSTV